MRVTGQCRLHESFYTRKPFESLVSHQIPGLPRIGMLLGRIRNKTEIFDLHLDFFLAISVYNKYVILTQEKRWK
jgi:hypothetical protein